MTAFDRITKNIDPEIDKRLHAARKNSHDFRLALDEMISRNPTDEALADEWNTSHSQKPEHVNRP